MCAGLQSPGGCEVVGKTTCHADWWCREANLCGRPRGVPVPARAHAVFRWPDFLSGIMMALWQMKEWQATHDCQTETKEEWETKKKPPILAKPLRATTPKLNGEKWQPPLRVYTKMKKAVGKKALQNTGSRGNLKWCCSQSLGVYSFAVMGCNFLTYGPYPRVKRKSPNCWFLNIFQGNSLVAQQLGLNTFTAKPQIWAPTGEVRSDKLCSVAKKKKIKW